MQAAEGKSCRHRGVGSELQAGAGGKGLWK